MMLQSVERRCRRGMRHGTWDMDRDTDTDTDTDTDIDTDMLI